MPKDTVPDYSHIQITVLPPGRAVGAGDLTKWAHNRAVGRSGTDDAKTVDKTWKCIKCKKINMMCIHADVRFLHKSSVSCRHCGQRNYKIGLRKLRSKS